MAKTPTNLTKTLPDLPDPTPDMAKTPINLTKTLFDLSKTRSMWQNPTLLSGERGLLLWKFLKVQNYCWY